MARKARTKTATVRPVRKGDGVIIKTFSGYFLIVCLIVAGYFLFTIFQPFFTALILAAILATVFFPLYYKIFLLFKESSKIASIVTCFLIFFLFIIPLFFFFLLLWKEASETYIFIQGQLTNGVLDPYLKWHEGGVIYDFVKGFQDYTGTVIDLEGINLKESLTVLLKDVAGFLASKGGDVAGFLASKGGDVLKGLIWGILTMFILFFAMYYFFKDHEAIIGKIMALSPLPLKHESRLIRKFREISHATFYGMILKAIVQGALGGIGFFFAGVPNPIFWGTSIAVFSLVPVIGTFTLWGPASLILLIGGNLFSGIFLLLWGFLVISTSDNILLGYFIGERTDMNQLLMFLAVIGGVLAFGLIGIIFGPLILTLFFAFLHIYETEYDRVLHGKK